MDVHRPGARTRLPRGPAHPRPPRVRGPALAASVLLVASCGGDGPTEPPPTGTPNQRPVAAFTTDVTLGPAPLAVAFDARASTDPDGTLVSYAWDFGDGTTGTGATVTHVYPDPGTFTPTLTVTDDRGSQDSEIGAQITVNSPPGTGSSTLEGTVYHDRDRDGMRDPDEETVPDQVVFLDDDADGERDDGEAVSVTDADGRYRFEGLEAGRTYRVTQELTIGWTNTDPGTGSTTPARSVLPPVASRIIGGSVAEEGAFPFQVALVTAATKFQFCGGTFIAASWVLTASHCLDGTLEPSQMRVLAGTQDLRTGGELIPARRFILHPAFGANGFVENDIALIELEGSHTYPRVELLTPERAALAEPGVTARVIGWGRTTSTGDGSPVLKTAELPIISNTQCQAQFQSDVKPTNICTGVPGGMDTVCQGDSGGPLLVPFRDRWLQAGIVSFGPFLCFNPEVFARVSALIGFVRQHVPTEASGTVLVEIASEGQTVTVDFGNFR